MFVFSVVDGCMPSDLGAGTSAEIEIERRLLYVDDAGKGRSASSGAAALRSAGYHSSHYLRRV